MRTVGLCRSLDPTDPALKSQLGSQALKLPPLEFGIRHLAHVVAADVS